MPLFVNLVEGISPEPGVFPWGERIHRSVIFDFTTTAFPPPPSPNGDLHWLEPLEVDQPVLVLVTGGPESTGSDRGSDRNPENKRIYLVFSRVGFQGFEAGVGG